MAWWRERIRDLGLVVLGLAVLGGGLRLAAALAAVLGPSLGPGWAAVVGLVVAAPVVAAAWSLVVDGPRATAAVVRVRRGRR